MRKANRKNILIYLFSLIIILYAYNSEEKSDDTNMYIEYIEGKYEYSKSYSNGIVYICRTENEANKLCESCNESDVIVIDETDALDPNVKIIDSYKIRNENQMNEILKIIFDYSNDTDFKRSIESMKNEWIIHNICSSLNIKKTSTDDVDLNNADEIVYKSKIISKIF